MHGLKLHGERPGYNKAQYVAIQWEEVHILRLRGSEPNYSFKTNAIVSVEVCQEYFDFDLPILLDCSAPVVQSYTSRQCHPFTVQIKEVGGRPCRGWSPPSTWPAAYLFHLYPLHVRFRTPMFTA